MDSRRLIIRRTLWLLPLIFILACWGYLRHGIEIDRLEFAGFQVEKLYLKLDKRLFLRAQRVVIPRAKSPAGPRTLQSNLERLHRALRFFDAIELERVDLRDGSYRLIYRDNILYIKSPEFEIAGMVYNRGKVMEVQFPLVRILRRDVTLSGELFYRYADGSIEADGFYQVPDLGGAFRLSRHGDRIDFRIDSMQTASLQKLMKLFTMSREAREWLSRRISAKSYQLEYLEGHGRYDAAAGEFRPDIASLRGAVRLRSVRIRFNDTLKPIVAPSARVVLQEGSLYFLLDRPRYGKHSLQGSHAALLHLNDPARLLLLLRLYYKGRLDWQVLKILHAYGMKITLGQKEGSSESRVDLDIPLGKGEARIRGITRFTKGVLEFGGREIRIGGGSVAYTSDQAQIRSLQIEDSLLNGVLNGRIDLRKRQANLKIEIQKLRLRAGGETVISARKVSIPVTLRWNAKQWSVALPSLKSDWRYGGKEAWSLEIRKLALWKPYLKGLPALADDGRLTLRREKGSYSASGSVVWNDSPFYTRKGRVKIFPFRIGMAGSALRFDALEGKIAFRSDQRVLRIENLNVDAKRLIEIIDELKRTEKSGRKSAGTRLTVLGKKSIIRYGPYVLLTDTYRLDLNGKRLRFEGVLGKDHVQLVKEGEKLTVDAKRIGDRMLHSLIHFNGLQGGRYTLHLEGTEKRGYTGEIIIDGGVLKDVRAYNDMIALFNTIPALVTFSNPGFSSKGFEIKKGRILFGIKGEKLTLESILLEGRSSTVAGKGTVRLDTKELDVDLAVQTAREVGKTIGQIPLVGYILFGKDKSLTAGVKIKGTMEKPEVRTNPVGEALLYPLELLRRTLMAPSRLGQDDELPPEAYTREKSPSAAPPTEAAEKRPMLPSDEENGY